MILVITAYNNINRENSKLFINTFVLALLLQSHQSFFLLMLGYYIKIWIFIAYSRNFCQPQTPSTASREYSKKSYKIQKTVQFGRGYSLSLIAKILIGFCQMWFWRLFKDSGAWLKIYFYKKMTKFWIFQKANLG